MKRISAKQALALSLLVVSGGISIAGCDGDDLIQDPTFREWDGDKLARWTLEAGSIRKAPTWHANDPGVELVGTPTVLTQLASPTWRPARCVTFSTIADVEPSAQVTIGLDFNNDGTIDYEQPIAATGFHEAKTEATAPSFYDGLRFVLTKKGFGRAVLAQIRAQATSNCSAPPVALHDLPLGMPCSHEGGGDECRSGICCDGMCAECCTVPANGQTQPNGAVVPPVIVACRDDVACTRREARSVRLDGQPPLPRQCAPASRARAAGAECLADDDCASAICEGTSMKGLRDGGAITEISACEADASIAADCLLLSARGGRCR